MPKSLAYAVFVLITAGAVYGAMQTFGERDASVAEESGELLFPGLKRCDQFHRDTERCGP